jgi:hypothetical protein
MYKYNARVTLVLLHLGFHPAAARLRYRQILHRHPPTHATSVPARHGAMLTPLLSSACKARSTAAPAAERHPCWSATNRKVLLDRQRLHISYNNRQPEAGRGAASNE